DLTSFVVAGAITLRFLREQEAPHLAGGDESQTARVERGVKELVQALDVARREATRGRERDREHREDPTEARSRRRFNAREQGRTELERGSVPVPDEADDRIPPKCRELARTERADRKLKAPSVVGCNGDRAIVRDEERPRVPHARSIALGFGPGPLELRVDA